MTVELDHAIQSAYFRMAEAQRQRIWMQRIWHPELFEWKKKGAAPVNSETTGRRIAELAALGLGEEHYQRMLGEESQAKTLLAALARDHCLWEHFRRITGFREYLCGAFVAAGGDIGKAPRASSFWKGMGLDVLPDGSVPRRERGNKETPRRIPCLPHVSLIGEQIRQQINRGKGPLKEIQQRERAVYDARYPDRPKLYNWKASLRNTQKIFYACLWEPWREDHGLDAPWPYAFGILNHDSGSRIWIQDLYDR